MANSNLIYGVADKSGFTLFQNCTVNAEKTEATCRDSANKEQKLQLQCNDDGKCTVNDIFPISTDGQSKLFLDLKSAPMEIVLDVTFLFAQNKAWDTVSKLQANKYELIVDVKYKEPLPGGDNIQSEIIRFKATERNVYENFQAWQNTFKDKIASVKYYVVKHPEGANPQTFEYNFANLASMNQMLAAPQSFIITLKAGDQPPLLGLTELKQFLEPKSGNSDGDILVTHFTNPSGQLASPTIFVSTSWEGIKAYTSWLEATQQSTKIDNYSETKKISEDKIGWRAQIGPKILLGQEWPESYKYHVKARDAYLDPEFKADVSGTPSPSVKDDSCVGPFDMCGLEIGGSLYILQNIAGIGASGSWVSNGDLGEYNLLGRAELDIVEIFTDDPPISVIPYGAVGATTFRGQSLAAQLNSHLKTIDSDWGFQWQVGGMVPIKLHRFENGTELKLLLDAGYSASSTSLSQRFGLTNGAEDHWTLSASLAIGQRKEEQFANEIGRQKVPNQAPDFNASTLALNGTTWLEAAQPEPVPPPPPPPAPVVVPEEPLSPSMITLPELKSIKFNTNVEFIVSQLLPVKGETGEGAVKKIPPLMKEKILEAYPVAQYPDGIPQDSVAKIIFTGNSSPEGDFKENQKLSAGRANTVSSETFPSLLTLKSGNDDVFGKLVIKRENFFVIGKGETEPLDMDGNLIPAGSFGGYENDNANTSKAKDPRTKADLDPKFRLCASDRNPKADSKKCDSVIEASKPLSRRVGVEVQIVPKGTRVEKPSYLDATEEQRASDADLAQKIVKHLTSTAWFQKTKGIKKFYYNKDDNSFHIVLDKDGYDKNLLKIRDGLVKHAGEAQKKFKSALSSFCTVKLWVYYENGTLTRKEVREKIRREFYQFDKWPFAGGLHVDIENRKYNTQSVVEELQQKIQTQQSAMADYVSKAEFDLPGSLKAYAIPVKDLTDLSMSEHAAIRVATRKAKEGKKKLTLYVNFADTVNNDTTTSIANILRSSYPELTEAYTTADNRLQNYVVIVSGDNAIDLTNDSAKETRTAIFKKLYVTPATTGTP